VRVCVMAESLALLETMTGTILVLERKLSEPLNFSFFPTYNDASPYKFAATTPAMTTAPYYRSPPEKRVEEDVAP
jgi:hypothetical protein